MYIDTEGTFRPERLLAVAERSVLGAASALVPAEDRNMFPHGAALLVKTDPCEISVFWGGLYQLESKSALPK